MLLNMQDKRKVQKVCTFLIHLPAELTGKPYFKAFFDVFKFARKSAKSEIRCIFFALFIGKC